MPQSTRTELTAQENEVLQNLIDNFGEEWGLNYTKKHKYRCLDDACQAQELKPDGTVLNIGGAPYLFEVFAQAKGLKVDALDIDISRHPELIAKLGLNVINCDFEDPQARKNLDLSKYDIVCLCEVLEHMRLDLIGSLKYLSANMKKDAKLFLTTPNFFFAPNFFMRMITGRSGPSLVSEWSKLESLGHMGHIREYSRKELIELFEYAGFKVDRCTVRNSRPVRVSKTLKGFLPSLVFKILSETFNLFGQEFIFILSPK